MNETHHPTPLPDDELAQRAANDREAFSELYRRYLARVYRYCRSRVGSAADAEDITAQVFLDALRALPRYRAQGNFAAWLFAIARRRSVDHHRGGPPPLELFETLPDSSGESCADAACLNALLATLPPSDLELLRLRYAADLDYAQIGHLLARSPAAVKMAHHRLLLKLRARWEDDHD
jgi:RNA polymerase sigma factor (sigma-70 family)